MALSEDHRPDRQSEQERIENNGGTVLHMGTWRVEGVLAVTRAIGDKDLKKCVTAEPFVVEIPLEEGDESLIMASDGLWDFMTNQEVVDEARLHTDPSLAAKALVDKAIEKGSKDNVTVCVVHTNEYYENLKALSSGGSPSSYHSCQMEGEDSFDHPSAEGSSPGEYQNGAVPQPMDTSFEEEEFAAHSSAECDLMVNDEYEAYDDDAGGGLGGLSSPPTPISEDHACGGQGQRRAPHALTLL